MGVYNGANVKYSDGTLGTVPQTIYGGGGKLTNSTEPFSVVALNNDTRQVVVNGTTKTITVPQVQITWGNPSSGTGIVGLRVLRNQDGFSEHSEDGVILYESYAASAGTFSPATKVLDGDILATNIPPLTAGRYAYYTTWLLISGSNSWALASYDAIIVPKSHSTVTPDGVVLSSSESKFLGLLPRIYTSDSGSATDDISTSTDIYKFLSGFAYTLDEIQTSADLLEKTFSGLDVNPNFVSVISQHLGLPLLPNTSLKTQKKLIRQVPSIYQLKGTALGLKQYVSSLTNYSASVADGANLLISIQDSSFYLTTGNWATDPSGITLTTDTTSPNTAYEKYALNNSYTASVVTTATNKSVYLGVDKALYLGGTTDGLHIFKAVPVVAGSSYALSFYSTKINSTTSTITPSIIWYDYKGTSISTSSLTANTVSTSWVKTTSSSITAPTGAVYAGITFKFSAANTYRLDMVQLSDPSVTAYHEGGSVEVYLAPPKTNFLKNPSFSSSSSVPWTFTNTTGSASYPTTTVPSIIDGSTMVSVNGNTSLSAPFKMSQSTDLIGNTGQFYTFSIYALNPNPSTTIPINITLYALDDSSNILASKTVSTTLSGIGSFNWQRLSVNLFVPSSNASAIFKAEVSIDPTRLSTGAPAYYTLNFDCAQLEYGYTYTDFFDGDYVNRGAAWSGTSNASVSYAYPAKSLRIMNLNNTITNFLPINTPYIVTSGYGGPSVVELSGIS